MWQRTYQLNDEGTVRNTSVRDFQGVNLRNSLELLIKHPENQEIQEKYSGRVRNLYRRCQDAYDRREGILSGFKLDSEYFPIVLTRSLLPQLGRYIQEGDYQTAYLISKWIVTNMSSWEILMCEFGSRIGVSPRALQKQE